MGNFSTIEDIRQVSAESWDALIPGRYPFASHAFLSALEASGCVSDRTGWQPAHRILTDENDRLIAAVPAYVKSHSYGEYVFDWAWAEAYQRYAWPITLSCCWASPSPPPRAPACWVSQSTLTAFTLSLHASAISRAFLAGTLTSRSAENSLHRRPPQRP